MVIRIEDGNVSVHFKKSIELISLHPRTMIRNFILNHEKAVQRFLEMLPAIVSWTLITFPVWGAFVFPIGVAYFVLLFNVLWFYKSTSIAVTAIISHIKITAALKVNWLKMAQKFPKVKEVKHIIIIPTYKEPLHTLERTLDALKNQTFPTQQITAVIAFEAREPESTRRKKQAALIKKFGKHLDLMFTVHVLAPGEVVGKSSNERHAGIEAKKRLVDEQKHDMDFITVTSCDADHVYHPQHFAYLTYEFLDNPYRYNRFWQPGVMFYNNFWKLPALTRVANTFATIWNTALLSRADRLLSCQNYSTSLKLLHKVGYWDADVIPEDYRIFFKSYFKLKGKLEVEPLYIPLYADAAESVGWWSTLINQYEQYKRWAWGVSDDPYIIKNYFLSDDVPFADKTVRVLRIIEDHFLWPVNWFIVTLGVTIPSIVNPNFSRMALGHMLPKFSSLILTICLAFLVVIILIDAKQRPAPPDGIGKWRSWLIPFEFILMPLVGFFFTALPGLDAHTRLLLGKYLEYRVTEKV